MTMFLPIILGRDASVTMASTATTTRQGLRHQPGHGDDTSTVKRGDEIPTGLACAAASQRATLRVQDSTRVDRRGL